MIIPRSKGNKQLNPSLFISVAVIKYSGQKQPEEEGFTLVQSSGEERKVVKSLRQLVTWYPQSGREGWKQATAQLSSPLTVQDPSQPEPPQVSLPPADQPRGHSPK